MGFKSKIKVARFVQLRVRMKNYGIGPKGICKFFMLHLKMVMTKGFCQNFPRMVTDVTEKYGWKVFFRVTVWIGKSPSNSWC
jgi:hypothetical protein